jgi:hypothetical protein
MTNTVADGIYVVATSKGNMTVYWAAATPQADAVAAVERRLPPGWGNQLGSTCNTSSGMRRTKVLHILNAESFPRRVLLVRTFSVNFVGASALTARRVRIYHATVRIR